MAIEVKRADVGADARRATATVRRRCAPCGESGARGRAMESPEVLEVVLSRLRVIGEPTRVQIMELLDRRGSATVQEVTDGLSLVSTRQNVSKHLGVLYAAGLLRRRRDGVFTRYELADWSALWLVEQIAVSVQEQFEEQRVALVSNALLSR